MPARATDLYTPRNAHPPRIADARGGDPTTESLDLSRPRPKKIKAEHWPHQIATTPRNAHQPRIADARGGDPTVESLDLSRPHPKKVKAEHWPHQIAAAWGRVMPKACLRHGDARRAAPAVSRSVWENGPNLSSMTSPMVIPTLSALAAAEEFFTQTQWLVRGPFPKA
ncbi:MAG: hypothetical protein MRY75_13170 [Marivita sp.]|uniref:hypothetical protein n=1 Tax=Marivita sp. TaxID=2003365 RepID=UPI0025C2B9F6|nr:hypothetical protein [Marivita sp.]MCI5111497.1 hypothetical protein [Marivita sp.]